MSRRGNTRYLLISFMVLMIFNLLSCSNSRHDQKITLQIYSRLWTPLREQGFIHDQIIPRFVDETGINVNFSFYADDALNNLIERDGGKGADILIVYGNKLEKTIAETELLDLSGYNELYSGRTFIINGKFDSNENSWNHFLPVNSDVYLFIASKKAEKYRRFSVTDHRLSWEEAADWMVTASVREGHGLLSVTQVPGKSLIYFMGGIISAYGGYFPDLTSDEASRGLAMMQKMMPAVNPRSPGFDSVIQPLLSGDAWFAFAHCARIGSVIMEAPDEFEVFLAPSGDKGMGSVGGISGAGIPVSAEHPEEAVQFLEFLSRPEIQVEISRGVGGFIPVVKEAGDLLESDPLDQVILKGLTVLEEAEIATIPADYPEWNNVKQVYEAVFSRLLMSGMISESEMEAVSLYLSGKKGGGSGE